MRQSKNFCANAGFSTEFSSIKNVSLLQTYILIAPLTFNSESEKCLIPGANFTLVCCLNLNDHSSDYDDVELISNIDDLDLSADLDDLADGFNKLKTKQAEIESTSKVTALGRRGYTLNAYDIAKIVTTDFKNEKEILAHTCSLHSFLHISEKIIAFVNNINVCQSTTSKEVVPFTMSQRNDYAARNDAKIKLRNLMNAKQVKFIVDQCIGSIRRLGKYFKTSSEILESSRKDGKHEIIKMVKSNIAQRLTELERCIDEIKELETTINDTFNEGVNYHLQLMLKTKFPNEISDIKEQVNFLERTQMDSHVEIRCKQEEVARYSHLISETQKLLPRTHQIVEPNIRRMENFRKLSAAIEKTIGYIPTSAYTMHYLQWFNWWSKHTTKLSNVENSNEDVEKQYFGSIIYARKAKSQLGEGALLKDLKELYDVFTAQYKVANAQLEKMKKLFEENMRKYQLEIEVLLKKLAQLIQQNYHLEMLVDILIFSLSIEKGTSLACSPLIKILTVIKNLVTIVMELLASDDGADIFIVGKLLKKQGEFLSSYSESLIHM